MLEYDQKFFLLGNFSFIDLMKKQDQGVFVDFRFEFSQQCRAADGWDM